jgi:hypothetical protein
MINFEFKWDAKKTMNTFSLNTQLLNGELKVQCTELLIS